MVGTEAIGSQTRQHSSLDVQAVSCYTEEKQSQEGEGDEKDTLCVSRHYLQKPLKSPVISGLKVVLLHHYYTSESRCGKNYKIEVKLMKVLYPTEDFVMKYNEFRIPFLLKY